MSAGKDSTRYDEDAGGSVENGFRIIIAQADQMPQDLTCIAMNADDYAEAYAILTARGFIKAPGTAYPEMNAEGIRLRSWLETT